VKCFVHAQENEIVRFGKRIFSEERNVCARSAIAGADGTCFLSRYMNIGEITD